MTCLVCASCTSQREALVQDDITITTPVEQTKDSNGKPFVKAWTDGGTTMIRITDVAGKQFDIYFDRRLDRRINLRQHRALIIRKSRPPRNQKLNPLQSIAMRRI